ncbi:MAG: prepilin-type N-terminal cleavage/methylation domain-containing protein, partial [Phycisphaerae bacterium]|nr:prepilin-type N-terminal cleavage/methylation domain-containing protein [Phycisphaerae bacterium]
MKKQSRRRGFSILEMLIALAISVALLTATMMA